MEHQCSIYEGGPNGHIVVVHVEPQELLDTEAAAWRRVEVSRIMGGMDAMLRCCLGDSVSAHCQPYLQRYASDPIIDCLPRFTLIGPARLRSAA